MSTCVSQVYAQGLAPAWEDAIQALASGTLSPEDRRICRETIDAAPNSPALTEGLVGLLDAYGTKESRPLTARIEAIRLLRYRGDTRVIGDLFQVMLASRMGRLPKEPDLHEGSILSLLTYPEDALGLALRETLGPALLSIAHERVLENWSGAMLEADSPVKASIQTLPPMKKAESLAFFDSLLHEFSDREHQLIGRMRASEGAAIWKLTLLAENYVVEIWLQSEDPGVAQLGAVVARGLSFERRNILGTPGFLQALRTLSRREGEAWADARAAAAAALRDIPEATDPGDVLAGNDPICLAFNAPLFGDADELITHWGTGPTQPLGTRAISWILAALILGALSLALAISRRRPFLMFLGSQGFAIALLILAEGVLRATGVGFAAESRPLFSFVDLEEQQTAFLKKTTLSGEPYLVSTYGWTRFQEVPAKVGPKTVRMALLGASSVHAPHFTSEETWPPYLDKHLELLKPGTEFEVINAGQEGTISYGVLNAGLQAMEAGAKLLVVYYGHNEVARFMSLARYQGFEPRLMRLRLYLNQSALFLTLLKQVKTDFGGGDERHAELKTGDVGEGELEQYRTLATLHLKQNIGRLLEVAAEKGVGMILVNPIGNLPCSSGDFPENASYSSIDMLDQARNLAQQGRVRDARQLLKLRIKKSSIGCEVHPYITAAFEELAANYDVPLVNAESIFYGDPEGPALDLLFWDRLHPTPFAYDYLSKALAPIILDYMEERGDSAFVGE